MRYGILLLCLFILSVQHCYSQCNGSPGQCVGNQSSTSSPAPTGGQYAGGTVVTFCYTMQNYEQCSTNWIHTFDINLGPGWDASTIMPISSPSSCGFHRHRISRSAALARRPSATQCSLMSNQRAASAARLTMSLVAGAS